MSDSNVRKLVSLRLKSLIIVKGADYILVEACPSQSDIREMTFDLTSTHELHQNVKPISRIITSPNEAIGIGKNTVWPFGANHWLRQINSLASRSESLVFIANHGSLHQCFNWQTSWLSDLMAEPSREWLLMPSVPKCCHVILRQLYWCIIDYPRKTNRSTRSMILFFVRYMRARSMRHLCNGDVAQW